MAIALPLIAIYLYTKFYLNANSKFKVICPTWYRTDGWTKRRLYASPFWEHNKIGQIKDFVLLTRKAGFHYSGTF